MEASCVSHPSEDGGAHTSVYKAKPPEQKCRDAETWPVRKNRHDTLRFHAWSISAGSALKGRSLRVGRVRGPSWKTNISSSSQWPRP